MIDKDLKEIIVRSIVNSINPQKIILFGSYAYGTPSDDSDIDLLIIKDDIKSKIEEKRKARKSLSEIDFPKDILVATSKEYEFYSKEIGSVFQELMKRGLFYGLPETT